MAFIADTAFEARITNNEFDDLCNIAGIFTDGNGDPADCSAGFLCGRNQVTDCEGFTGVTNENTWQMVAATSTDNIDVPIYACNTYDNQLISNGANNYFVGTKTLGLGVPAGRYGTFTRINFDNVSVYRFGVGNIDGTLSTESYLTIDDGLLKPESTLPSTAGDIFFLIVGSGNFIEGTSQSFGYVDVVACKVSA